MPQPEDGWMSNAQTLLHYHFPTILLTLILVVGAVMMVMFPEMH